MVKYRFKFKNSPLRSSLNKLKPSFRRKRYLNTATSGTAHLIFSSEQQSRDRVKIRKKYPIGQLQNLQPIKIKPMKNNFPGVYYVNSTYYRINFTVIYNST